MSSKEDKCDEIADLAKDVLDIIFYNDTLSISPNICEKISLYLETSVEKMNEKRHPHTGDLELIKKRLALMLEAVAKVSEEFKKENDK